MDSTLPPDPYKALGLSKDVDSATIKSTYRKLVLKCHPDKVADESLKKQKQEEFHKIQQAWEVIGNEDKRANYDAEVRLEALRKEKAARAASSPRVDIKTTRYDVRTAAPAGATFTANGPSRYDERKPSRSYDEDRLYDDRTRKYDTYDAYPKHTSSSRTSREKEPIRVTRTATDRTRSDHKKTRDREERRDRSTKYAHVEDEFSSNDEKARYEADYQRRSDEARNEARRRADEEDVRIAAAEARRKAEDRRSYEDPRYDRQRKLSDQENDAVRYIHRSKVEVDSRPSPGRTTSRDARPDSYERSTRRDRPETVRRSSARPKEPRPSSSGRDRDRKVIPEIVEWDDDRKPPPSFKHSSSSPAELHVPPRTGPQRSYTESSPRDHRRTETSPSPTFRRSETMPSSSSRRKDATITRPSLRSTETLSREEPRSRSPETYPTVPPPASGSTKKYYYPTPSGGVRLSPEDVGVANGHRTVLMEPARHRTRSPSPLSRPPMGPNRQPETSSSHYQSAAPKLSVPPPPLGRSATMNIPEDRGRSRLYGEVGPDFPRRENARRQNSFDPESVAFARKIGPDDIRWSRGRDSVEKDREYGRPTVARHPTSVY